MTTIRVSALLESTWATAEDALRLSARIKEALNDGESVLVDFTGVERLVPSFLGVAIGGLYQSLPAADLDKRLRCTGLDLLDRRTLADVRRKAGRSSKASLDPLARARQRRDEEDWLDD